MAFDAIGAYGTVRHMKAKLLFRERRLFDDGAIMEMTIWRVPTSVPPTTHGLKYSLFSAGQGSGWWATTMSAARAVIGISPSRSCRTISSPWNG